MDNFLQVPDEKLKKQDRKSKTSVHSHITTERIEKLKKTFQPFWMRGMMPHDKDGDVIMKGINSLDQI